MYFGQHAVLLVGSELTPGHSATVLRKKLGSVMSLGSYLRFKYTVLLFSISLHFQLNSFQYLMYQHMHVWRAFFFFLFFVFCFFFFALYCFSCLVQADTAAQKQELTQLRARCRTLQSQLEKQRGEASQLQKKLDTLKASQTKPEVGLIKLPSHQCTLELSLAYFNSSPYYIYIYYISNIFIPIVAQIHDHISSNAFFGVHV